MLARVGAPVNSHYRDILQQNSIGLNYRDATAGETDHQQAALRSDAFRRQVENIAAYRIVNDVGATAARNFLDPIDPTAIAVIEGECCALGAAEIELRFAPGSGNNARAECFADL